MSGENWISIKERLPKTALGADNVSASESVLIWFSDADDAPRTSCFTGIYLHDSNGDEWWIKSGGFPIFARNVTHWMPLPAPPTVRRSSQNQTAASGVEGAHEGTTADESGSREPEKLNNAQKCKHERLNADGVCDCGYWVGNPSPVALAESSLSSPPPKCACTEKMMCAFHELSGDPATAKLFQEEK